MAKIRRDLLVERAQNAGETKAEAEARIPKLELQVIDISFDAIQDPSDRAYFMNMPTSFVLPAEDVDRLRDIAGQILRQSEEFELIVSGFNH